MSNRKIEISPSVLGADLMRLGEEIRMVEALGIHWLHLDNMDGHFAPNISFGPDFVRAIRRQTKLFLDTHLMLSEPMKYIEAYARAGADLITVHAEADDNTLHIFGTGLVGGIVDSENDHRIAMSAAIAAIRCTEPVTILGAQCVQKSYPKFFDEYRRLGGRYEQYLR